MKIAVKTFKHSETIPARDYLKNKKLDKYFSRETAAAFVCLGELLDGEKLEPFTPFYYSHGLVDFESYGLKEISDVAVDSFKRFSNQKFIQDAMPLISPLTQFKVLYNMTQCFISIEYGLKGDSAALYSSAQALLSQALYSPFQSEILLGAGKISSDGTVETAFALVSPMKIQELLGLSDPEVDAVTFFKQQKARGSQ